MNDKPDVTPELVDETSDLTGAVLQVLSSRKVGVLEGTTALISALAFGLAKYCIDHPGEETVMANVFRVAEQNFYLLLEKMKESNAKETRQ